MIGRASVWSDPKVQALAKQFVPAADEVWFLQHVAGAEGEWFRPMADQGHYKDRGPNTTRQGIYAAAPSGRFLASINHNDPRRVAAMLERALATWKTLSRAERLGAKDGPLAGQAPWRWEDHYPADGLVLRVNTRDLPRARLQDGWRGRAWNQDYAWFRADEQTGFLPDELRPGETRTVPHRYAARLARLHLIDTVRGQSPAFPAGAVERAHLTATVTHVRGPLAGLRLEGDVRLLHRGRWRVEGLKQTAQGLQERGLAGRWLGRAVWDTDVKRFVAFELLWLGKRWGASQYNCRADDQSAAPMGVAFTLASDTPAERVAPAQLWSYGWRVHFPRAKK